MLQPLIERDFYGRKVTGPITPADLKRAYYTSDGQGCHCPGIRSAGRLEGLAGQ